LANEEEAIVVDEEVAANGEQPSEIEVGEG
jgi:hypothetical protein